MDPTVEARDMDELVGVRVPVWVLRCVYLLRFFRSWMVVDCGNIIVSALQRPRSNTRALTYLCVLLCLNAVFVAVGERHGP